MHAATACKELVRRCSSPPTPVDPTASCLARVLLVAAVLAVQPALAEPLISAAPASVGFAADRLQRLTDTWRPRSARARSQGPMLLIARNGKAAYFEALGALDPEKKTPMRKDAIFRIYSTSKPITSVTAMMLVEQGRLALADPLPNISPNSRT